MAVQFMTSDGFRTVLGIGLPLLAGFCGYKSYKREATMAATIKLNAYNSLSDELAKLDKLPKPTYIDFLHAETKYHNALKFFFDQDRRDLEKRMDASFDLLIQKNKAISQTLGESPFGS